MPNLLLLFSCINISFLKHFPSLSLPLTMLATAHLIPEFLMTSFSSPWTVEVEGKHHSCPVLGPCKNSNPDINRPLTACGMMRNIEKNDACAWAGAESSGSTHNREDRKARA